MRRAGVLAASYASLPLLAALAYATVDVHLGALAVIPILFISYYVRPPVALSTAFVAGIVLGLLDESPARAVRVFGVPPLADALILSIALCTIVLVANRLRAAAATNELLHGRLQKARREAELDALTGIPNRSYFMAKLAQAIERESMGAGHLAVLFCDLDGFKKVNDTRGHLAGDHVLRLAAERLKNVVRAHDTVARIGGDEFAILAEHVRDGQEALHVAQKIEEAFINPFHVHDDRHTIGITVGISLYPEDGTRAETLLHIADARMYRAKHGKRGTGFSHGTISAG